MQRYRQPVTQVTETARTLTMDGGEDSLTVIGELAKELHDGPRRLRIETGRRLVKEDEKSGLGDELDTTVNASKLSQPSRKRRGIEGKKGRLTSSGASSSRR